MSKYLIVCAKLFYSTSSISDTIRLLHQGSFLLHHLLHHFAVEIREYMLKNMKITNFKKCHQNRIHTIFTTLSLPFIRCFLIYIIIHPIGINRIACPTPPKKRPDITIIIRVIIYREFDWQIFFQISLVFFI